MQNKVLGRISLTDLFSYSLIHSLGHVKCLISLVVAPSFVFRCVIISISDLSPHFCTAFLTPNVRHTCCTPQPLQVFSKLFRIVTFRRTKQHEIWRMWFDCMLCLTLLTSTSFWRQLMSLWAKHRYSKSWGLVGIYKRKK